MSAYHAKQQFEDNMKNYADSPEKQNLYRGLANIAEELEKQMRLLQSVKQDVERLKRS